MILTSLLLTSAGVRIGVLGDGRLRFNAGHTVAFSREVTLSVNSAGLLADTVGRPVLPPIRVSGGFTVAMNGTVSVSGHSVGRLVLQRPNGDIGFPGEGTFGVLQVGRDNGQGTGDNAPVSRLRSPIPSSATVVTVRPRTEVTSDRILLRDVADLAGDRDTVARLKDLDLGEAPVLGTRRTLTKWGLQAAFRNYGLADGSVQILMPLDATVARKGQNVDVSTIMDAATAEARKVFGDSDLSVVGIGPAPIFAPAGELSVEATSARSGERMAVTVRIRVDGKPIGERTVGFSAKLDGIKSGEAVRIRIERNGAVLETDGKAKSSGYVGDTIQVATSDGAVLSATVMASGQVKVNL